MKNAAATAHRAEAALADVGVASLAFIERTPNMAARRLKSISACRDRGIQKVTGFVRIGRDVSLHRRTFKSIEFHVKAAFAASIGPDR
ncbi:hypothetical protein HNQ96_001329 [Aminobacter lissarensis]|uniref:Uncharacterized protein n=1 Tax=Aminobacter carboxidus TaxID=376165 RepID=A0A8E2BAF6_9HYPH|nr:hypothetical protein [Aminobacter lissarensis]MBB6465471.1 hypothetical protein [Aminobacter lissarensis]